MRHATGCITMVHDFSMRYPMMYHETPWGPPRGTTRYLNVFPTMEAGGA